MSSRELQIRIGVNVGTSERETIINNSIEISGREVAKQTAKSMEKELNTLNKRNIRLGGAF